MPYHYSFANPKEPGPPGSTVMGWSPDLVTTEDRLTVALRASSPLTWGDEDISMWRMKVEVFDPPMCCPTGVCGPSVDPVLPRFAADLEWLKRQGVEVERRNMAQELDAFMANRVVSEKLTGGGTLPFVLVDGRLVAEGTYPTRGELAAATGVSVEAAG